MYRKQPYTGANLPSRSLCLTYDDGPGKDTFDIAKFLCEQNIRATFFVIGKYAFHHQDILKKITELGHLIGNHTYDHPDMPYYLSKSGDIQGQVLRTDTIIKKYLTENTVYFRSPYGKWSQEVANELNLNMLTAINHVGPVNWDIGGVDCFYWQNNRTVEDAVDKYLSDINDKGRGIVVMHDEIGDMEYLKDRNNTLELTKQLIPRLKLQGYNFVRLDEIESIKKDASEALKFTLRSANAKFVSIKAGETSIGVDGMQETVLSQLSMEDLGHGKIALRAANGLFLSLHANEGCVIKATGKQINKYEAFDLIPLSSDQIMLRAYNGNYLSTENKSGGRLLAVAPHMRGASIFSFLPVGIDVKRTVSISERYRKLKREILFVRSKIQERSGM